MRTSAIVSAAAASLMLTACDSSDRQTPSLDLPITAPPGVTGILADFIEVCSLALVDRSAAMAELSARNWQAPSGSDLDEIAAFGGFASESENGETLQIYALDFPHVEGVSCNVFSTLVDDVPDFDSVTEIPGLQGEFRTFGPAGDVSQLGRFSGIGPNGYPVTIQIISSNNIYLNLAMTSTRPVKPSVSNQE